MTSYTRILSFIKKHEGNFTYMYLDTRGNVTVGVGYLLSTASMTMALSSSFSVRSSLEAKKKKSADEAFKKDPKQAVTDEFKAVGALSKGRLPSYYKTNTTLDLAQSKVDALLKLEVVAAEKSVKGIFEAFDTFPEPAQVAIIDMAYNLGTAGFKQYETLISDLKKKDWATAATHCKRTGPSQSRNDETKALFEEAQKDSIVGAK